MLDPTFREVIEGHAEVLQTFKAGRPPLSLAAGHRWQNYPLSQVRVKRVLKKVFEASSPRFAVAR